MVARKFWGFCAKGVLVGGVVGVVEGEAEETLEMVEGEAEETAEAKATELGLLSVSAARSTPLHYMSAGSQNVLLELACGPEDEAGFHCGADVSPRAARSQHCALVIRPRSASVRLQAAGAGAQPQPPAEGGPPAVDLGYWLDIAIPLFCVPER